MLYLEGMRIMMFQLSGFDCRFFFAVCAFRMNGLGFSASLGFRV